MSIQLCGAASAYRRGAWRLDDRIMASSGAGSSFRLLFAMIAVTGLVLLSSGPVLAQPSEAAVRRHVNGLLPAGVELERMTMRVFPDAAGGAGRVSMSGVARASVDLFQPISRDAAIDRLRRDGLSREAFDGYLDRIYPRRSVDLFFWDRRMAAGSSRMVSAELRYLETVSGATLSGAPQHGLTGARTMQQVRQTRGPMQGRTTVHLITDDPATAELVAQVLQMRDADREREAAERVRAEEARQAARRDFLDLIETDMAWFTSSRRNSGEPLRHRLLARISDCRVVDENEAYDWEHGWQRVMTIHRIQADCTATTNLGDQGRFRFTDGLEIYPAQKRPLRIQFGFPVAASHDWMLRSRETVFWVCLKKIAEDEGRGGVAASLHTLGEFSCRRGVAQDTLAWTPDRDGFSQGEYGWIIRQFDAALSDHDMTWRGPEDRDPEPAAPASDYVAHETWFIPGARFEGYREGPDGARLPLTMEVTARRQVHVTQGGSGCARTLRLGRVEDDLVRVYGTMALGRVDCAIDGTVDLRATEAGELHYVWRARREVATGVLTPVATPVTLAPEAPDVTRTPEAPATARAPEAPSATAAPVSGADAPADDVAEATDAPAPAEVWLIEGARFEGLGAGPGGDSQPMAVTVTGPREVRFYQGSETCSRLFWTRATDEETVTFLGRHMVGRPDCRIGERLQLRATASGQVHYALRRRNGTIDSGQLTAVSDESTP